VITGVSQRWRGGRASYRPAGEPINTRLYEVAPIDGAGADNIARAFIEREHYSGSMPAARERVGLYRGAALVGVIVFSQAIDIVRSKHAHRDLVRSLTAARQARGETPGDARALAERLVMSDSDHWQPLFIEEARDLGLPVRVDADPVWYQVLRFAGWSRWPG
jgi:hypothetical protein